MKARTYFFSVAGMVFMILVQQSAFAMNCAGCCKATEDAIAAAAPMILNVGGNILHEVVANHTGEILGLLSQQHPDVLGVLVSICSDKDVQSSALKSAAPILKQFGIMDQDGNISAVTKSLVLALTSVLPAKRSIGNATVNVLPLTEALEKNAEKIRVHDEE